MKLKEFTTHEEKEIILKALKQSGRKAYDEARAKGVAVTVLRGNDVCRIDPDGDMTVVAKSKQAKYKVVRRKYNLE